MKKYLILSLSALLFACNPLNKLPGLQSGAEQAFSSNDFQKSYTLYKQYIELANNNDTEVSDNIYLKLAQVSGELGKMEEASKLYYSLLEKNESSELINEFATLLQSKGTNQQEIDLWNKFELDDENLKSTKVDRLINLYSKTESYDAVIEVVANKGNIALSNDATMQYITALENTDSKIEAAKVCNQLVKEQPDYIPALEWKGKYYYEKADARYKAEMAKYNKNKNATTYAYLLRDLKKVSADFRVARDTFETLRKYDAENKSYIKYLKNCYLRLEQKAEAAKMDRLLK
ncbi:tetratricopeptide repeat protein [Carboxylicivirga linearis]|uniref:Tetratricopeptide repeat protein n=1 Tax=Carboxylicivirga linearis TaxID=1628157 RepID=A0ABS5JWP8_9BACT|nr:hypothetical protein [Carboxylicivirga linearis]MBS2098771.1 hypothetical protein [Carboxylicivirga linearis]